jgi:hypothetical protein
MPVAYSNNIANICRPQIHFSCSTKQAKIENPVRHPLDLRGRLV